MKMLEDLEEVVRNESRADQGCWRMWANQLRSGPKNSADLDKSDLIADFTGARTHNLNFVQSLVLWFRTHHATIRDMAARLEAAERDAALLDWLDQNAFSAYRNCDSIDGLSKHCVVVHEKPGPRRGNVADGIREAITQAMQETGR